MHAVICDCPFPVIRAGRTDAVTAAISADQHTYILIHYKTFIYIHITYLHTHVRTRTRTHAYNLYICVLGVRGFDDISSVLKGNGPACGRKKPLSRTRGVHGSHMRS